MISDHVESTMGSGWHCSCKNWIWAEVGILVAGAIGVTTEFLNSIGDITGHIRIRGVMW